MMGVFVQLNEDSPMSGKYPIGYVLQENGCWEWVGSVRKNDGYGRWSVGKGTLAHRVIYEKMRGAVPKGLELDHLCRNRLCVNPDHLEPVTTRENIFRGIGSAVQNAQK